jgi:hypothetical protein
MSINSSLIFALCAGLFGAFGVAAIGSRFTRSVGLLAVGGGFAGIALGALGFVLGDWCTQGFDLLEAWVLPLAGLTLLVVMSAQNWFVFYADRADAVESARPAAIVLCAALSSVLAAILTHRHSLFFPLIWAAAGSLAILTSIQPLQRAIEANRSRVLGTIVGICKVLLPLTGIIVLIPIGAATRHRLDASGLRGGVSSKPTFFANLAGLLSEIGLLLLVLLINGPRVPHAAVPAEPDRALTGGMPQFKRDSVVLILVVALHVLCGVVIVKH